ncbi:MAG: hypothetical protein U1B83_10360, partial [Candidatus Cloacimonadaceae bacterium]|nr:hypothetical protein [Candidatus Cloacimonadaceae bacterium]
MNVRTTMLLLLLLGVASVSFAVNKYAVANGSWGDTSTWSLTSGGAPGADIPTSGDDVYIGEGSGEYTVTIPSGTHSSARLFLGGATGNASTANLIFDDTGSSLTVAAQVFIYRASDATTRTIAVGSGSLTVNGSIHLSYPGSTTNTTSVSRLTISSGTITINSLNYYGATGQSEVSFSSSGLLNMYGNLTLVDGFGTLIPGTGTVNFLGSTSQAIDGGAHILFYDLKVNNNAGVVLSGLVVVENIWTQLNGTISGTLPNIDGFTSPFYYYIDIIADDNMMIGFSIDMTTPALYPYYIDRQWEIHNTYENPSQPKIMTFYWTDLDDHYYDWITQGEIPWVWNDGDPSSSGNYNVISEPKYTQAYIDDVTTSGIYNIGLNPPSTLPVELSSFTAVLTAQNYVKLDWVTQSETGVMGYYIYRSIDTSLAHAMVVSPMIESANSSQTQSYSFTDTEVYPGTYYYWLQNVDLGATSNFFGYNLVTVTE